MCDSCRDLDEHAHSMHEAAVALWYMPQYLGSWLVPPHVCEHWEVLRV